MFYNLVSEGQRKTELFTIQEELLVDLKVPFVQIGKNVEDIMTKTKNREKKKGDMLESN